MKRLIFCDVDEVLVEFARPALAAHGDTDSTSWPYALWDKLGITPAEFWKPIVEQGGDWWYNLPKMPWTNDLLAHLNYIDPDWRIATKPYDGKACDGRYRWIVEHCGLKRKWHMSLDKSDLAAPGRLLLDDYDGNCDAWRRAGGDAILVPRPHNSLHWYGDCVFEYIVTHMEKLGYHANQTI